MSRLPPVDPTSNPELADTYDHILKTRGVVSDVLRSMSHAPEGLRQFAAFGEYVRYGTELKGRVREIAIMAIGRGNQYAWSHHYPHAIKAGVTTAEIDALNSGDIPDTLTPAEAAAVKFGREFTALGKVSDATFAEVAKHYSPRQITDLTLLGCYFVSLASTVNALGVDLETSYKPMMKPLS